MDGTKEPLERGWWCSVWVRLLKRLCVAPGAPWLGGLACLAGCGFSAALHLEPKQLINVPDNFAGCFLGGRRSSYDLTPGAEGTFPPPRNPHCPTTTTRAGGQDVVPMISIKAPAICPCCWAFLTPTTRRLVPVSSVKTSLTAQGFTASWRTKYRESLMPKYDPPLSCTSSRTGGSYLLAGTVCVTVCAAGPGSGRSVRGSN